MKMEILIRTGTRISFFISMFIVRLPRVFLGYLLDRISFSKDATGVVCKDLRNQGIHIFEERLAEDAVFALLKDFEDLKKSHKVDRSGQQSGRIYSPGVLSPLLASYAEKIKPFASEFLSTKRVKVEISYYQESFSSSDVENIPGGDFHVDDNKANLKYFIYLSDVSEENGPFSCVPKTGSWRLKASMMRAILWELTHNRKYLYDYRLDKAKHLSSEVKILGLSGLNFLVDTTSLHRANPVISGMRKVAVISFNRIF